MPRLTSGDDDDDGEVDGVDDDDEDGNYFSWVVKKRKAGRAILLPTLFLDEI